MTSLAIQIRKKKSSQLLMGLMIFVFFFGLAVPQIASAAIEWGNAFESVWDNTKGLLNPGAQFARAGSITADWLIDSLIDGVLAKTLAGLSWLILKVAVFFLQAMAGMMDFAIQLTIMLPIAESGVVQTGWAAVRDFSNMFFIFALLYIAIQTILGLAGGNTKRMLAHVIIAAVLINFSLFATTVVVDAGNILAVSFWDKMKVQRGGEIRSSASQKFIGAFDLQTILEKSKDANQKDLPVNFLNQAIINVGGTIFMVIAGYVFLAGALMMVTRTVMLALLMIFSPFAFMAFGLPKLEKYGREWLDKLIAQTFAAPFFIFMIYLSSVVVDKVDLLNKTALNDPNSGQTWSAVFLGQTQSFGLIYNYILLIGFLIASIAVANKFAGEAGNSARGWAKSATKWMGGAATGGAVGVGAWTARQSLGKLGMMTKDRKVLHDMAAQEGWRGVVGRGAIAMSSGASRASFDVRGTKLGASILSGGGRIAIGKAGGAGGLETTGSALSKATFGFYGSQGTAREKEVYEAAERRYKDDPKGKEAYLRANLGTEYKVKPGQENKPWYEKEIEEKARYDTQDTHKDLREKVERGVKVQEAKDTLEKETKEYNNMDGMTQASAIGERVAKKITDAMGKLTSREIAELLPKYVDNGAFVGNLSKRDLHAINQRDDEGKYDEEKTYQSHNILGPAGAGMTLGQRVAEGVFVGKNQEAQEYLASPEGQKRLFNISVEKEGDAMAKIERNKNIREAANKSRIGNAEEARIAAYAEKASRESDAELEAARRDINTNPPTA